MAVRTAGQELRAVERLSRAVVEGLEEGVVVTDAELRPVSWNASALRILGVTARQLAADGIVSPAIGTLRYGADWSKPRSKTGMARGPISIAPEPF